MTDHLDLWTSALLVKSTAGRGSNGRLEAYGIRKLRALILELAVLGKLVPQDPQDEPASVLLERLAKEKKRKRKINNSDSSPSLPVSDDEIPFQLPSGWLWSRFIDVLDFEGGSQPPKSRFSDIARDSYIQLIQIRDLGPSPQPVFVPKDSVSKFCNAGDIMVGRYGASVGKVFWGKDGAYNVALIKLIDEREIFEKSFLFNLMQSPLGQSYFLGISRSAQDGFSKNDIAYRLIPVPPKREQHRIVAKVDELMALCDQLEQQQGRGIEAHQTLVETLLGTLTNVASAQEFAAAWNRIFEHFDTLFTTEHSIDQLKQTILQLAIMGKLVIQDPDDESANVLLKKIAREKGRLIAEGKIRRESPLPPVAVDERLFNIPENWEWVRLGTVLRKITDGTHHSPPNGDAGEFLYISAKNIKDDGVMLSNATYVSKKMHEEIYSRCDPELGDVLYIKDGATTGIAAINNLQQPFSMLSSVALLKCPQGLLNKYLLLSLRSPYFYSEMRSGMTGVAITRVTLKKLNDALITLPPLPEQHRIVAKVDELIALCDALKARLAEAQATQIRLADAIVERAVSAPELASA